MTEKQQNIKVNMYNFSVNIVSADGLAHLCARTSAGIVMAMREQYLKRLIYSHVLISQKTPQSHPNGQALGCLS